MNRQCAMFCTSRGWQRSLEADWMDQALKGQDSMLSTSTLSGLLRLPAGCGESGQGCSLCPEQRGQGAWHPEAHAGKRFLILGHRPTKTVKADEEKIFGWPTPFEQRDRLWPAIAVESRVPGLSCPPDAQDCASRGAGRRCRREAGLSQCPRKDWIEPTTLEAVRPSHSSGGVAGKALGLFKTACSSASTVSAEQSRLVP